MTFSTFQSNITRIYRNKGKAWLDHLPKLVEQTALRLSLHDLEPVPNLSYNYVLSGFQGNNPIILKLGLDSEALQREAFALRCFVKCGAVKVLTVDAGLLLLERVLPGSSLKSYFPNREVDATQIACNVMKQLYQAKIPEQHSFPHIKDWLSALDKTLDLPVHYLQRSRKLRDRLLETVSSDVLLHGDLHHDNILRNGDAWSVIDPKGVIGDASYEIAAFIRNPIPDLLTQQNTKLIIQRRITVFANSFDVPPARIRDWCFVQTVLAWIWALEDGSDTSYFEQLAKLFDRLLFG